eukprot:Amastigsp_a842479_244.p1 type:complete len:100 gc:universal Amastigsp_a842479_244:94-393(+)
MQGLQRERHFHERTLSTENGMVRDAHERAQRSANATSQTKSSSATFQVKHEDNPECEPERKDSPSSLALVLLTIRRVDGLARKHNVKGSKSNKRHQECK